MLLNIATTITKIIPFVSHKATTSNADATLTQQLNRKGLLVGLAMEHDTIKMYLTGKLDGANAPIFKELLKNFIQNGYTSFVFDLANLKTLDSAGVAALVRANVMVQEFNGEASVINPTQAVFQKLISVNFHHLVTIEEFSLVA